MIRRVGKRLSPLCFLPSGKLVCYNNGNILVLSENDLVSKLPIPITWKEKLFGRSRYFYRLFRMGVRTSISIDENHIVYSIGNMLYEMNLVDGRISKGYFCGDGIRPLIFTSIKSIEGFEDGLYFGGYLSNMEKKPVNIYKRISEDQWQSIYTFPNGIVNHVHVIVSDPYRQCLWIFTGDFDEASAIWKVTDNFKKVERIAGNDQKYRGCVAFALPEGLLYATDAPFADDFIYLMDPETIEVKTIAPIDGSCIYGCQWKDKFVFSSTVEGDGRNLSMLELLFGRKRGAGIKDNFVHMYCGNIDTGFDEIFKLQKDILPLFLFQFGVFKFPSGINYSNTLYFQPIGSQNNDLNLMSLKIKKYE